MNRWFWLRHGPTHQKVLTGQRDVPADLTNKEQIQRLNAYLPRPALIFSSDLVRASATADTLTSGRGSVTIAPDIREFDFGDWDGKHFSEIAKENPTLSRTYWETPGDVAPPNGESWNMVSARVWDFISRTEAEHSGRDIIAVAHIGVILTVLQRALSTTPYKALSHDIAPLSVTEIHNTPDGWSTRSINHLP